MDHWTKQDMQTAKNTVF